VSFFCEPSGDHANGIQKYFDPKSFFILLN
jgi:hypothetical protein